MSAFTSDRLMAFADGQLPEAERAAVEAHLAANPDIAAEIAARQRQSDALRTLFAPAGAEPVPARLRPAALRPSWAAAAPMPLAGPRPPWCLWVWVWARAGLPGRSLKPSHRANI
ncbi:zf-HC2 domain-containing protein [Devosia sp. A8/3-2]|nr:zf-HC2 domain-containing protein [Devosia sp. A8/3-2]